MEIINNFLPTPENPEMGVEQYYQEAGMGPKRIFNCLYPDCGKTFRFYSEIRRHLTVHSSKRHYHCSFPGCKKSFKRADALTNHNRVHLGDSAFTCFFKDCNAKFSNKSSFNQHLLKHGQKNFVCTFEGCNKAFETYEQVKKHEETYFLHFGKNNKRAAEFELNSAKNEQFEAWDASIQYEDSPKASTCESDLDSFRERLTKKLKTYDSSPSPTQEEQRSVKSPSGSNMSTDCLIDMLENFIKENEELKVKLRQTFDLLEAMD